MTRRHDIDALRVLAFGLLILYHVGMVYVAEWGFHVKSAHTYEWLQWPMIAINRWRMPLLFVLSGIALGLALTGRDGEPPPGWPMARTRSLRLLLPLAFGIVAVVPVQVYCEALANGVIERGFVEFMLRYLQFQPWPEGGWAGAEYGLTWNHLWYLAYLWLYTMLLLALRPALDGVHGNALRQWSARRHGIWGLLLPAAWFFACQWWLAPRFPETHALGGDWYAHAKYFAFFLLGYLGSTSMRFWDAITSARWPLTLLALFAISVELGLRAAGRSLSPGDLPAWALQVNWAMIERGARALYSWSAILAILAWARIRLNHPFPWLRYANEAVYPWYILHQSLIVPLAFALAALALAGWQEALLVLLGTIAGCLLLHEYLIRRTRWLRPLFGLKPQGMAGHDAPSSSTPTARNTHV